jgi:hypothetical protein
MRNKKLTVFARYCALATCDGPIVGDTDTVFRGVPLAPNIFILFEKMPTQSPPLKLRLSLFQKSPNAFAEIFT